MTKVTRPPLCPARFREIPLVDWIVKRAGRPITFNAYSVPENSGWLGWFETDTGSPLAYLSLGGATVWYPAKNDD